MQQVLIAAISLHVLAAVAWAGSTFALARGAGSDGERLFAPQMAAAAVAILAGGYLWRALHRGASGPMETVLGLGAAGAILALAVQAAVAGGAVRNLRRRVGEPDAQRARIVLAHRLAAVPLAAATLAMAAARFA